MYEIRIRNWWKNNESWPGGLEPCTTPGRSGVSYAKGIETEAEAQAICREYNATHRPRRLSPKAEYSEP